jgi:hypothetical protein
MAAVTTPTDRPVDAGRAVPPARDGIAGAWDRFVGPGATTLENAGSLGSAVVGGILAVVAARGRPRWAQATVGAMAIDLWGGAWTNNTPSCVRWYERPGQGRAQHLRFAAAHVHPFALAALDGGGARRWAWACAHYGYLMATTTVIRRTATRRRRAVALAATAGGVAIDWLLGPSTTAPWFAPVFAVKLLAGHAGAGALGPATTT